MKNQAFSIGFRNFLKEKKHVFTVRGSGSKAAEALSCPFFCLGSRRNERGENTVPPCRSRKNISIRLSHDTEIVCFFGEIRLVS